MHVAYCIFLISSSLRVNKKLDASARPQSILNIMKFYFAIFFASRAVHFLLFS